MNSFKHNNEYIESDILFKRINLRLSVNSRKTMSHAAKAGIQLIGHPIRFADENDFELSGNNPDAIIYQYNLIGTTPYVIIDIIQRSSKKINVNGREMLLFKKQEWIDL